LGLFHEEILRSKCTNVLVYKCLLIKG